MPSRISALTILAPMKPLPPVTSTGCCILFAVPDPQSPSGAPSCPIGSISASLEQLEFTDNLFAGGLGVNSRRPV